MKVRRCGFMSQQLDDFKAELVSIINENVGHVRVDIQQWAANVVADAAKVAAIADPTARMQAKEHLHAQSFLLLELNRIRLAKSKEKMVNAAVKAGVNMLVTALTRVPVVG